VRQVRVVDADGHPLPTHLLEMLYLACNLLERKVGEIASLPMAETSYIRRNLRSELQTLSDSPARHLVGKALQRELSESLRNYTGAGELLSMLRSFNVQSDDAVRLAKAVFIMLGRQVDDKQPWEELRTNFGDTLLEEMCSIDVSNSATHHERWRLALKVSDNLDYPSLLGTSEAVRFLLHWFEGIKFVHLVAMEISEELKIGKQGDDDGKEEGGHGKKKSKKH